MLTPFRLGVGGRLGDGKQWMSWIHVADLVRLILFSIDNDISGPLNGSSPRPVTNAEFTRTLARAVHRPAVLPIPQFVLKMALGEMSSFLFDSQRVVPTAAQSHGFGFEHADLTQSLTDLVR
jgi:uncharacterized protein (TIGR01777 family)